MQKQIKISIIGDNQSGKSTFISSIVGDKRKAKIEKMVSPLILPAEFFQQSDIFTIILDSQNEDRLQLKDQIQNSDCIILIYDITNEYALENLRSIFLPLIQENNPNIPVILLGNKLDLANESIQNLRIQKMLSVLIKEYKQIELGLECSSLYNENIQESIYCARRSILYPSFVLYDFQNKTLTEKFQKALVRIFRIIDQDNDNLINDQELQKFQLQVFQTDIQYQEIIQIKELIKKQLQNDSCDNGITQEGFIAMNLKSILMLKLEVCWNILKYFDYDHNLDLQIKFDQFEFDNCYSIEMQPNLQTFLQNQFYKFSDPQNLLSLQQLDEILYPAYNCFDINDVQVSINKNNQQVKNFLIVFKFGKFFRTLAQNHI